MEENEDKLKWFIFLQVMLFIFSFGGVFSKLASKYEVLSKNFILFYGISIIILFIYSIGWQFILKNMNLTLAFSCKAIAIVWSMFWGVLFFDEIITWNVFIGAAIIMVGIVLVVKSDK